MTSMRNGVMAVVMFYRIFRAVLLVFLFAMVVEVPVFGQSSTAAKQSDRQLVVRLNDLTRRKGNYFQRGLGVDFCRNLGLKPFGNCAVYQSGFPDGRSSLFHTYDEPGTGKVRIIIISFFNSDYAEDYLVGLDGSLQRAVRRKDKISTPLSRQDAAPGFRRAIEYWRSKQEELSGWPDAKLIDDGTCPNQRIKRIPKDPSDAVCVDRDLPK
jgi:hypothetical protein